jgi:8-oxo-dGTP pyrophosphatase MutT (NUDIX family)
MKQSYLIFSGDRRMEIEPTPDFAHIEVGVDGNSERFDLKQADEKVSFISNVFEEKKINHVVIKCNNPRFVLELIKKNYDERIAAGGGLVIHRDGSLLLIFRKGKWDLPKGKLDAGESPVEGAIREVKEETGLSKIEVSASLGSTYHTYIQAGRKIFKETFWYLMHSDENVLIPQSEEDITSAEWLRPDKLEKALENTYPNVELLIRKYLHQ